MSTRDFTHVIQDINALYLGAKLTYAALMDDENVPFKLKSVYERLLRERVTPETSLEAHFYHMDDSGFDFRVMKRLKVKAKVMMPSGSDRAPYTEKIFRVEELVKIPPAEKEAAGFMIQEIIYSKLALFSFTM